jgi:hypothetical protein
MGVWVTHRGGGWLSYMVGVVTWKEKQNVLWTNKKIIRIDLNFELIHKYFVFIYNAAIFNLDRIKSVRVASGSGYYPADIVIPSTKQLGHVFRHIPHNSWPAQLVEPPHLRVPRRGLNIPRWAMVQGCTSLRLNCHDRGNAARSAIPGDHNAFLDIVSLKVALTLNPTP